LPTKKELQKVKKNQNLILPAGAYYGTNYDTLLINKEFMYGSKLYVKCVSNNVKFPSKKIVKKPFKK